MSDTILVLILAGSVAVSLVVRGLLRDFRSLMASLVREEVKRQLAAEMLVQDAATDALVEDTVRSHADKILRAVKRRRISLEPGSN